MSLERQELMSRVEACLSSDLTPEEVCSDRPELAEEVGRLCGAARRVQAELDAMFPPSDVSGTETCSVPGGGRNGVPEGHPRIPGYEFEAVLGYGGMGVVYRARHVALNRVVALKMLLSGAYASPAELSRFLREAEAIAGLCHPNIVQVYDLGDVAGRPYFTMEFLRGGHLGQKLEGTPLPSAEAARLLRLLAAAVDVAHRAGIVHRDLKPANILLAEDGTPKVADFGLARRVGGDDLLTCSGARVGTPSYMAPEQVSSRRGSVGPAADVYALGAILYEMLTGRPPFRGESVSETERQLLADDPVPPSRLNTRVPRDLQTICLACLRKDPERRYASAADLAEDLRRYGDSEPVRARATGRAERAAKWARRHPTLATALGGAAVLSVLLVAGLSWSAAQRAAVDRAAEADLAEGIVLQRAGSWREAGAVLDRAATRLGDGGGAELRAALARAREDQARVGRLEGFRMLRAEGTERRLKFVEANAGYAAEFLGAHLGTDADPPAEVPARVRSSNIRVALVDALDEWAQCSPSEKRGAWIAAVARAADVDPAGWRGKVRDPAVWADGPALARAVAGAEVAGQPAPFLLAVAARLDATHQDSLAFLARVQQAHPGDYWANLCYAGALQPRSPVDSLRYYQVAVSLRPDVAVARNALAGALGAAGRTDEALVVLRQAMRLDPRAWTIKGNYATALFAMGRREEAMSLLEACASEHPTVPDLPHQQGDLLLVMLRRREAVDKYWAAVTIDPNFREGWRSLWSYEARVGELENLRARWEPFVASFPASPVNSGYAELCLFLGREEDYRRERTRLLARFGDSTDPQVCERVGRACLLLPGTPEEIATAAALIDRAVAAGDADRLGWTPYFRFARALADYRQGHYEKALKALEGDAGRVFHPAAWLVGAACHARLGQTDAARLGLANAAVSYDWAPRAPQEPDAWRMHLIRRDAEAAACPDLDKLLSGERPPADNKDRFAMLPSAQFSERYALCAKLWSQSIARNAKIGVDHAFAAASACVLAGSGVGSDADTTSAPDRAAYRANALEWLSADLGRQLRKISAGGDDAKLAWTTLRKWRSSAELSFVRDDGPLASLPKEERADWQAFWAKVDAATDEKK